MASGRFAPSGHANAPLDHQKTTSFPRCYGGEFKGDFPRALGDSQHVRIPPAAHTYQSDVETVHRLEEDEFFDLEDFSSRGEFLAKVHTYQLYFNLARPNSHKENQSPWQIIERLAPRSPPTVARSNANVSTHWGLRLRFALNAPHKPRRRAALQRRPQ